ncbi:hypothetical protein pb186bvf_003523 [Paramecium bursaria]
MSTEQEMVETIKKITNPNDILYEIKDQTAEIIFNRPKQQNAFNGGMYFRFLELLTLAEQDKNVRSVLVRGNGNAFTSGNDLNNFFQFDLSDANIRKQFAAFQHKNAPPLIALCHGPVIGFIFPLISQFDQVYVTKDAYFFAPMLLFGQSVELTGSISFPRIFGTAKAFSLLINCEKLSASEAIHYGFAQKIFDTKEDMYKNGKLVCQSLNEMNQLSLYKSRQLIRKWGQEEIIEASRQELLNVKRIWESDTFLEEAQNYLMKIKQKAKL